MPCEVATLDFLNSPYKTIHIQRALFPSCTVDANRSAWISRWCNAARAAICYPISLTVNQQTEIRQSAKGPACPGIYKTLTEGRGEAEVTGGTANILTHSHNAKQRQCSAVGCGYGQVDCCYITPAVQRHNNLLCQTWTGVNRGERSSRSHEIRVSVLHFSLFQLIVLVSLRCRRKQ